MHALVSTNSRDLLSVLDPVVERVNRKFCWIKTKDGPRRIDEALTAENIAQHLTGRVAYGACPMSPGESTTRLALLDFDSHNGEMDWEGMRQAALDVIAQCTSRGLKAIPFRSSGGQGIHLFFLWREPQDAYSVRTLLTEALADALFAPGTGGVVNNQVEVFPKQNAIPSDGYGSMFILPYAGKSAPLDETLEPQSRSFDVVWRASDPVPFREKPIVERQAVDAPELAELKRALDAIPNNELESLDYDEWRNIIFAIHHATEGSDDGLRIAHEFSARSPKYDPDFLDGRVWPYVRSDRDGAITVRTILAKAREHGYQETVEDDFEILPKEPSALSVIPGRRRFQVLSTAELLAMPRPVWVVKGVLPKAELVVLYGASGSGKSFIAIDLFGCVGRGVPWRGLRVRKSNVAYIAAEGQGGFRNRTEAYQIHHGEDCGLRVIVDAPNLLKTEDIKPLLDEIMLAGGIEIIVIDTLAQVSPGSDENSAEDMGRVLSNCRKLHRATGAMIVLIHHAGKDLSKGARGWSGLKAAADAEIEINRLDNERWVKITKSKDGEDGAEFPFRLLPVVLGEDEDGDEITSCVVEHQQQRQSGPREPSGTTNKLVWRVINELVDLGDGSVPVAAVVAEAVNRTPRGDSIKDQRPHSVRRSIQKLAEQGFAIVRDDVITTVSQ